jgi:predicted acylesterase/phospholipase RssA
MGALIGGFHAAGQLDAYVEWVVELSEWDVLRYLDISLTNRSGGAASPPAAGRDAWSRARPC